MIDQFDQVAALGASCAATAAAARSRMRHLLALYIRAGGRLVFSTGSDCCSNFSAYWVLEQFQRCWGCSGSLVAISGLYQILWVLRSVTDRGRYAAGKQAVIVAFKLCPILLLFSSLVFRASPRTAFERSMQAKARGLLPRIRVVALKAFLFMREYSTAWACSFPHRGTGRLPHRRDPSFHDLFRTLGKAEQGGGCNVRNSATCVLSFPSLSRAL